MLCTIILNNELHKTVKLLCIIRICPGRCCLSKRAGNLYTGADPELDFGGMYCLFQKRSSFTLLLPIANIAILGETMPQPPGSADDYTPNKRRASTVRLIAPESTTIHVLVQAGWSRGQQFLRCC